MKKVLISTNFEKFKKTKFTTILEAIQFVKDNKLSNARLKLKLTCCITEWDNF